MLDVDGGGWWEEIIGNRNRLVKLAGSNRQSLEYIAGDWAEKRTEVECDTFACIHMMSNK